MLRWLHSKNHLGMYSCCAIMTSTKALIENEYTTLTKGFGAEWPVVSYVPRGLHYQKGTNKRYDNHEHAHKENHSNKTA